MGVKEARRTAHRSFIKMVAQIGNGAKPGIVDQIGAEVIAHTLQKRGNDQREGNYVPGIVHVHKMGNEEPEIEMPLAPRKSKQNGALWSVRPQNLVENGLEKENAEGVKCAHH